MMPQKGKLCALAAAAAVLLAGRALGGQAPEEANDSVHLHDNSQTNVKIVEDDWKGVKVERSKVEIPIAVSRVRSTEYGDQVPQYEQGMDALRKSEFSKAVSLFKTGYIKNKDPKRRQYFTVGLIDAYEGQKQFEAMRKEIRKLVPRDYKKAPRLIYDAYLKLGGSLLREGKYVQAEKAFKEAYEFFRQLRDWARKKESKALPGVVDHVNGYRLRAGYWRIYCMEVQGVEKIKDREGARRAYDLFAFESTGLLKTMSLIGRARCDAILGKTGEAIKSLEKMEKDILDPKSKSKETAAVLGAVYVGLGDVHFIGLDYSKARWYYLTVIVKHAANRDAVARAHYKAGLCYEKLREKARERQALPRALRHFTTVTKEFQDSLEYADAKKKVEELKARMGA